MDTHLITPIILATTGSLFLCGYAFGAAYYAIPIAPLPLIPVRLQLWNDAYSLGARISRPIAIFSSFLWAYIAYNVREYDSKAAMLYTIAAGFMASAFVWTEVVMVSTNRELLEMVKRVKEGGGGDKGEGEKEAERKLMRWFWMSYVRSVMPILSAWAGLHAALK